MQGVLGFPLAFFDETDKAFIIKNLESEESKTRTASLYLIKIHKPNGWCYKCLVIAPNKTWERTSEHNPLGALYWGEWKKIAQEETQKIQEDYLKAIKKIEQQED